MEAILKLRRMRQEQEERKVAQRVSQFTRARNRLTGVEGQIDGYYDTIRKSTTGETSIQIDRLIGDRRYLNHLHQVRFSELQAIAKAQELLDKAKLKLAEAKKQTDIMEKVKDKARTRFDTEEQKKERLELDDLATSKFAWLRQTSAEGDN